MATPRFAWGIDVGNRALKAIRIVRDGEAYRIDDYDIIEHEQILSQAGDNREHLIQAALANFAGRHPGKGGAVAIGVSGQASFARFVKLPPVAPGQIPEIVKFEAVQQIPFPLEEVEWGYQIFQTPDNPEVEVGIFAMRREQVNGAIKNFTDVGLQVTTVQMNPLAVYNGLQYDGRLEGTTLVVDVGAENSDLLICEGENVWMRSIPIGGNSFTEALVKSFQLKFNKAEELKRNAATSKYARQILLAMKPVFSDLVSEIQRSIGYYSSTHRESRIAKVMALGGTFRLPGLQKYLQQNLQLDVVRLDRLNTPMPTDAKFITSFNENILSSIASYGLALQALDLGKMKSSLLPAKIKRERMWKEKTPWFALAAGLFVAGTAVPLGRLYADRAKFADQQPVRETIQTKLREAKNYDNKWREIESSGADDRKQITDYMALLADRDVNINLMQEIGRAFPAASPAEDAKARGQRRVVELAGFNIRFEPDISSYIAKNGDDFRMSPDEFNTHADKVEMVANSGVSTSSSSGGRAFGAGSAAAPVAAGAGAQKGYIITLLCRTPASDPAPLIRDTVVQALRSRTQAAADPPRGLSFERVSIPSRMKLRDAYPSGLAHTPKPPLVFTPPITNDAGSAPEAAPQPTAPPAPPDPFADPAHKGETQSDDALVTVLAAVAIDPPPAAPKPGTAGK